MRRTILASAVLFAASAGAVWAESVVYGFGRTRGEAIREADYQAARLASARDTCYRSASSRDGWCSRVDGGWRCKAEVAKYNRRNPGGVCPN